MDMEIQDLRIGNYLRDTLTGIERPCTFQTLEAINYGRGNYEPIPLTDGWEFNFKDTEYFRLDYVNGTVWLNTDEDSTPINHIKFIHQLQNIHHSITGQELIIKPT